VVFALSSYSLALRELAYDAVALVNDQLASAKFTGAMQLRYLICGLISRSVPKPFARLPSVVCSFIAEACQVLLDPACDLYCAVNQFLLTRPFLDISDVPMFYDCFQSGKRNSVEMRRWLFKILIFGIQSDIDVSLLRRRHLVPLMMACYDSTIASSIDRAFILKIFDKMAKSTASRNYLISSGFLTWLHRIVSNAKEAHTLSRVMDLSNCFLNDVEISQEDIQLSKQTFCIDIEIWRIGDVAIHQFIDVAKCWDRSKATSDNELLNLAMLTLQFIATSRNTRMTLCNRWIFDELLDYCKIVSETLRNSQNMNICSESDHERSILQLFKILCSSIGGTSQNQTQNLSLRPVQISQLLKFSFGEFFRWQEMGTIGKPSTAEVTRVLIDIVWSSVQLLKFDDRAWSTVCTSLLKFLLIALTKVNLTHGVNVEQQDMTSMRLYKVSTLLLKHYNDLSAAEEMSISTGMDAESNNIVCAKLVRKLLDICLM
jgi:hypothetical protein